MNGTHRVLRQRIKILARLSLSPGRRYSETHTRQNNDDE